METERIDCFRKCHDDNFIMQIALLFIYLFIYTKPNYITPSS
jgi:hypothetical protein